MITSLDIELRRSSPRLAFLFDRLPAARKTLYALPRKSMGRIPVISLTRSPVSLRKAEKIEEILGLRPQYLYIQKGKSESLKDS